jgi:hypothetical protein
MFLKRLIDDLRADPQRYIDQPSSLSLRQYFGGYEHVSDELVAAMAIVADRFAATQREYSQLHVGTALFLRSDGCLDGYLEFLALLEAAVDELSQRRRLDDGVAPTLSDPDPIEQFMPILRTRRVPMLIGDASVLSLRRFVDGYMRAIRDYGMDTSIVEQRFDRFEKYLRQKFNWSGRWERILYVASGDRGRSVKEFVAQYDAFRQSEAMTT